MSEYLRSDIGSGVTDILHECTRVGMESCESLKLDHIDHVYDAISDKEDIAKYHKNMDILRYFNALYRHDPTKDWTENDQKLYSYMGYLVRAVMARYEMEYKVMAQYEVEYKHTNALHADYVAILENVHERLGNLESCLPAPHQRRCLP